MKVLSFLAVLKLVALKLPLDRSYTLLKLSGCCACYQHSEDRICACLERLARPLRSDADRETPKPVLILFPVWYLFFYWESDFYSLLKHDVPTPLQLKKPAWCFIALQYQGIGVLLASQQALCVCSSLLLPLDSGFPRRAAHPRSHRLIGLRLPNPENTTQATESQPSSPRRSRGPLPWSQIEMWKN